MTHRVFTVRASTTRALAVLAAFSAAGALAGCGGDSETTIADGEEATIVLKEFEFDPSTIRLTAGTTVTLVLSNEGEKEHEMMAGHDVNMVDDVPSGFTEDFFATVDNLTVEPADALMMEGMDMGDEDMGDESMGDESMGDMAEEGEGEHAGHSGTMVAREPSETARITFTLTDESIGEWEMGCFEDDGAHWDDGMRGTIIVEEA